MRSRRPQRLSATFVKAVTEPGRYGDGRGNFGLSLLVKPTATGGRSKSFSQRLRVNGRVLTIGLGPWPLVTLAEAREAALSNARAARQGIDPIADRRRRAAIPTFRQAAERVIDTHAESWKGGGRTAAIWRARLQQYAYPKLGELRVDAVQSSDVLAVVGPLWTVRRETAAKVKAYCSAVFAWAIAEGHRADNPVAAIAAALPRAGGGRQHLRAMPWRDVADALRQVRESSAGRSTKDCFEFLVLTATRSGEARGARWEELDGAIWTIPGSRTKTGREHRVPLSHAALAVLERARDYADGSGLIFPSATGKALSDSTLSKMLRELGLAGTPHGMRSSFRDFCGETGQPREVAEASLAHQVGSAVERAYARSDMLERRSLLMEAWAEAIGRPS